MLSLGLLRNRHAFLGGYGPVSKTCISNRLQSYDMSHSRAKDSYSTSTYDNFVNAHPNDCARGSVAILTGLTKSIPEQEITQESLLVKLDDLVPLPDTFAIIHFEGHQYKVTQDDQIMVDRLDVPVQSRIIIDKVLLLGSTNYTIIGQPLLTGVRVLAEVEEHERTEKVVIVKKRRRKNYFRKQGFRHDYTLLRIIDVMGVKNIE